MDHGDAREAAAEARLDECLEGDRPWPSQVARARVARGLSIPVLFRPRDGQPKQKPLVVVTGVKR
jgi:hypothetical protein